VTDEERDAAAEQAAIQRAMAALDAIARFGGHCTCATTSVEQCPNFQTGDEAPDAFEEDE
jgi:hypothetical protein